MDLLARMAVFPPNPYTRGAAMSPFDQRGRLREGQFDYQVTADHRVLIRWHGKQVKILKGSPAEKFIRQAEGLDELNLQLLLARVTGNFKHGNEHKG